MPEHDPTALAVSEDGKRLPHSTNDDVDTALRLLILNGNNATRTVEELAEEGITVSRRQLEYWRDHNFRTRHYKFRQELASTVGEELAGKALERALQADDVEAKLIEHLANNVTELDPKDLPRGIQALAQAKDSEIKAAQLLRDKPTEITEQRSVSVLLGELKQLNVIRVEDGSPESPPNVIEDTPPSDPSP